MYSDIFIEGHNAELGAMTINIIMKDTSTGLEVDLPFQVLIITNVDYQKGLNAGTISGTPNLFYTAFNNGSIEYLS